MTGRFADWVRRRLAQWRDETDAVAEFRDIMGSRADAGFERSRVDSGPRVVGRQASEASDGYDEDAAVGSASSPFASADVDRGTILVNRVRAGERVDADDVEVDEDVAGEVRGRTVRVGGDVLPGARITVRGAGASIHVEGDVSADTVLTAEGCDAEVVVEGDVG